MAEREAGNVIDAASQKSAGPASIRGLARILGKSHVSVRRAILRGDLPRSCVVRDGTPVVLDADLAVIEWRASRAGQPVRGPARHGTSRGISHQRARLELRKLELDVAEREGRLLSADAVRRLLDVWRDELLRAFFAEPERRLLLQSVRAVRQSEEWRGIMKDDQGWRTEPGSHASGDTPLGG